MNNEQWGGDASGIQIIHYSFLIIHYFAMSNVEFTGTYDLARRLLLLEKKVRQSVAVDAMQRVNQQLIARVKSAAPSDTGTLRQSIAAKTAVYKSGKTAVGIVGPDKDYVVQTVSKRGKSRRIRPSKYAHLADLGTQQRTTQSGANRGSVAPQKFMERVRINYLNEAENIFRNAVNDAVNTAGS
ncbi:hypothetical protein FACS18942_04970 [Planctomycetales bacterium]|nr:hypothetical protein FACS18942_04970 [Planctomycetales bacterium]GHT37056.1 hypothetical protein FACS189427_09560 [Planctomycetales bacterium]